MSSNPVEILKRDKPYTS